MEHNIDHVPGPPIPFAAPGKMFKRLTTVDEVKAAQKALARRLAELEANKAPKKARKSAAIPREASPAKVKAVHKKTSTARYRLLYGKGHLNAARLHAGERDRSYWDKYYNAQFDKFMPKTGSVTIGQQKQRVRAADLYTASYRQGHMIAPKTQVFDADRATLVTRKPLKDRQRLDDDGLLTKHYQPLPEVLPPPPRGKLAKYATSTAQLEFYGYPEMGDKGGRPCNGPHEGKSHVGCKRHAKHILVNFPNDNEHRAVVLIEMTKPRSVNIYDPSKFDKAPQPGRYYFIGSDDFLALTNLLPDDQKLGAKLSHIQVMYVRSMDNVPSRPNLAMADASFGLGIVPHILSHEHALTATRLVDGKLEFVSAAPKSAEGKDDCGPLAIASYFAAAFDAYYAKGPWKRLTVKFLREFFGKSGKMTLKELSPFFEKHRLSLTVLNVRGQVVYTFAPLSRNKHLQRTHLHLVAHNDHLYPLDHDTWSLERQRHPVHPEVINGVPQACEPLKPPSPWFKKPKPAAYDTFAASVNEVETLLGTVKQDTKVSYTDDLNALHLHFRKAHGIVPKADVYDGHIRSLKFYVNGCVVNICASPAKKASEFTTWMNRFKRGLFNAETHSSYCENLKICFTQMRKAQLDCRLSDAPPFARGVDVRRAYTHAGCVLPRIPVFQFLDDFQAYAGEPVDDYSIYIVENKTPDDQEVFLVADRKYSAITGYVLKRCGLQDRLTVLSVIKPSHLAKNPFADLVKDLYASDADEDTKKLAPLFSIGMCGKMKTHAESSVFTTSHVEAYHLSDHVLAMSSLEGFLAVRKSPEVILNDGYYPFQFFVYDIHRLAMLNLYRSLAGKNVAIYAIKTDAFYVDRISDDLPLHKGGPVAFDELGTLHVEKEKYTPKTPWGVKDGKDGDN